MSAVQVMQVICDGPGCPDEYGPVDVSNVRARGVAAGEGWTRRSDGGDLCPACTRAADVVRAAAAARVRSYAPEGAR